jgi:hypothetical protein
MGAAVAEPPLGWLDGRGWLVLAPAGAGLLGLALEAATRSGRKNGREPPAELAYLRLLLAAGSQAVESRSETVCASQDDDRGLVRRHCTCTGSPASEREALDTRGAASRLRVTESGVRWLIARGRLSASKAPSGAWRVSLASVEDYERRRRGTAA